MIFTHPEIAPKNQAYRLPLSDLLRCGGMTETQLPLSIKEKIGGIREEVFRIVPDMPVR